MHKADAGMQQALEREWNGKSKQEGPTASGRIHCIRVLLVLRSQRCLLRLAHCLGHKTGSRLCFLPAAFATFSRFVK